LRCSVIRLPSHYREICLYIRKILERSIDAFVINRFVLLFTLPALAFILTGLGGDQGVGSGSARRNNNNPGDGAFVLVPAGTFLMGDNFGEEAEDELPVHAVYLDAYYIGRFEVTNGEFIAFLQDTYATGDIIVSGNDVRLPDGKPCCELDYSEKTINFSGGDFMTEEAFTNHPVSFVSWYGAAAYCNWLSDSEGLEQCYDERYDVDIAKSGYRLPTEAEWEKAARGTYQRRYPWGNDIDSSFANYQRSGHPFEKGSDPFTTPVGYFDGSIREGFATSNNASPYGAYDMAGNVWEWCNDWYEESYYQFCVTNDVVNNPTGYLSGSSPVVRGGSWLSMPVSLRGANRSYILTSQDAAALTDRRLGFRCARSAGNGSNEPPRPDEYVLCQNYPNPFNPVTEIAFALPVSEYVTFVIYNSLGQTVKTLLSGRMPPGERRITWDGTNSEGLLVGSGVYFYRIRAGGFSAVKKMVLIR